MRAQRLAAGFFGLGFALVGCNSVLGLDEPTRAQEPSGASSNATGNPTAPTSPGGSAGSTTPTSPPTGSSSGTSGSTTSVGTHPPGDPVTLVTMTEAGPWSVVATKDALFWRSATSIQRCADSACVTHSPVATVGGDGKLFVAGTSLAYGNVTAGTDSVNIADLAHPFAAPASFAGALKGAGEGGIVATKGSVVQVCDPTCRTVNFPPSTVPFLSGGGYLAGAYASSDHLYLYGAVTDGVLPVFASCPLNGCTAAPTLTTVSVAYYAPITISNNTLVWFVATEDTKGALHRCTLPACTDDMIMKESLRVSSVSNLAVFADHLYFASDVGAISRCPLSDCSQPEVLVQGETNPTSLTVDAKNLYWMTSPGALRRLTL